MDEPANIRIIRRRIFISIIVIVLIFLFVIGYPCFFPSRPASINQSPEQKTLIEFADQIILMPVSVLPFSQAPQSVPLIYDLSFYDHSDTEGEGRIQSSKSKIVSYPTDTGTTDLLKTDKNAYDDLITISYRKNLIPVEYPEASPHDIIMPSGDTGASHEPSNLKPGSITTDATLNDMAIPADEILKSKGQNKISVAIKKAASTHTNKTSPKSDQKKEQIHTDKRAPDPGKLVTEPSADKSPAALEKVTFRSVTSKSDSDDGKSDSDWVDSAFDLFVGGNYFGLVNIKYTDNWIEIKNPQEVIYLLPLVRDRSEMFPLFKGRIDGSRNIDKVGSIEVDYDNFALNVIIAKEQALDYVPEEGRRTVFDGAASFVTRFSARGNQTISDQGPGRVSIANNTRFAYHQNRVITSGVFDDNTSEYTVSTLQAESDFTALENPLTLAGGLLTVPGQPFVSSVSIIGLSLYSNHDIYQYDESLYANPIKVFVPTRALVEVYKDNAQTGEVLYSRMMDFGNAELDTSGFPRGSYPVVIVISVDGVEQSSQTEQFYKYENILPRDQIDLNLTIGAVRNQLDFTDVPVAYGSYRTRLTDYLEGEISFYSIDDRLFLNESLKGNIESQKYGKFQYQLNIGQSSEGNFSGYGLYLRWQNEKVSASINYSKSNASQPVTYEATDLLSLDYRENLGLNISYGWEVSDKRSLNLGFSAYDRRREGNDHSYRYGPSVRTSLFGNRHTSLTLNVRHDWTNTGSELRILLNLNHRFAPFTATSNMEFVQRESLDSWRWQNSLNYQGTIESPGILKNVKAKAIYSMDQETNNSESSRSNVTSLDAYYTGTMVEGGVYYNHSSGNNSENIGGDIVTTFVSGADSELFMTRSVSLGNALVALTLEGDPDDKAMISVLVNSSHKAYFQMGETVFVEVPVYETSRIELEQADTQKGGFVRIANPQVSVTPYPGNILSYRFYAVKLLFFSGSLKRADDTLITNLFFETGHEPAYTDSQGSFVVEMPIRPNQTAMDFIADNQLCHFDFETPKESFLIEVGEIVCEPVSQEKLEIVRSIHEENRIE